MPGFYKLKSDNKFHATSWYYRVPVDDKWHPVKNMFYKTEADNKWHPVWLYEWETNKWSECTAKCGGGTQTRTVRCKRSDTLIVHDSFCDEVKPPSIQVCNTRACQDFEVIYRVDNAGDLWLSNAAGEKLQFLASSQNSFGYVSGTNPSIRVIITPKQDDEYVYLIARVYDTEHPRNGNVTGVLLDAQKGYWSNNCPEILSIAPYGNLFSWGRKHNDWVNNPCWIGAGAKATPPRGVWVEMHLRWKVQV